MRMVRVAVLASLVVAVGVSVFVFRQDIARKLGFAVANAAESAPAPAARRGGRAGAAAGPVPVVVHKVDAKSMPIIVEAVGTVQSIASVQLMTRIDSQIMKVNVAEGALLGSLPIAVGHGAGAELRQPLGVTVVGGLLVSQSLTLFITPVVYIWFDKLLGVKFGQLRIFRRKGAAPRPAE